VWCCQSLSSMATTDDMDQGEEPVEGLGRFGRV